jgi:hypothetical protein
MAGYVMPRIHFRHGQDGKAVPMTPRSHYDSVSDTYFIFFYGEPEPSISLDVTKTMYALLDPDTDDLIGIQIEAFLTSYVPDNPWVAPLVERRMQSTDDAICEDHGSEDFRALANYFVGSLMTEGNLSTA